MWEECGNVRLQPEAVQCKTKRFNYRGKQHFNTSGEVQIAQQSSFYWASGGVKRLKKAKSLPMGG